MRNFKLELTAPALQAASEIFEVSTSELLSDKRDRKTSDARRAIYAILRESEAKAADIAADLNRERSTVIMGIDSFFGNIEYDELLRSKYSSFRRRVALILAGAR